MFETMNYLAEVFGKARISKEEQDKLLAADALILPVEFQNSIPIFRSDSIELMKYLKIQGINTVLVKAENATPKYIAEHAGDWAKFGEFVVANWDKLVTIGLSLAELLLSKFGRKKIEFKFTGIRPDGTALSLDAKGPAREVSELVKSTVKEWTSN
jgi:hypothetical protein